MYLPLFNQVISVQLSYDSFGDPFLGTGKSFLTYMLCFLLPQSLGNSQREYEKHVLLYSIRNQLRFRNNLGESASFTRL